MGSSLSPCYIAHGEGALVTDVDGNQFIDLTGGWGCLAVGHTHKKGIVAPEAAIEGEIYKNFLEELKRRKIKILEVSQKI